MLLVLTLVSAVGGVVVDWSGRATMVMSGNMVSVIEVVLSDISLENLQVGQCAWPGWYMMRCDKGKIKEPKVAMVWRGFGGVAQ
jgi:hypothetical protein